MAVRARRGVSLHLATGGERQRLSDESQLRVDAPVSLIVGGGEVRQQRVEVPRHGTSPSSRTTMEEMRDEALDPMVCVLVVPVLRLPAIASRCVPAVGVQSRTYVRPS